MTPFIVEPLQKELPPEGTLIAVCSDVIYLGFEREIDQKTGQEKWVEKGMFVFQTEERDSQGKRFLLFRKFTASVWNTSALFEILTTWVEGYTGGRYQLNLLVGRPALLSVKYQNALGDGHTYGRVVTISRLMPGMRPIQPENYERPEKLAVAALNAKTAPPRITAPVKQVVTVAPNQQTKIAAPFENSFTSKDLDDLMSAPVGEAPAPSTTVHDDGVRDDDVPF